MKKAYLFPGQGSQTVGMGKALAENFKAAADVFAEVDEALSQHLSKMMFEGSAEDLTLTTNAQPAIMASSLAVWRVLQTETDAKITDAAYVAGHSLGEYSALCAAETFSLADTARLLRIRGDAMQAAVPQGQGGMAAIIGLDSKAVRHICIEANKETEPCVMANFNAPGQIVISGSINSIHRACELAKEGGAKRALLLNVSAPFHSPLMEPAAERMAQALADVTMQSPKVPLIANVTADAVSDAEMIRQLLIDQVTGSVLWSDSIETLYGNGVRQTVELGTGKVLSGLVRKVSRDIETQSIEKPEDIAASSKAA